MYKYINIYKSINPYILCVVACNFPCVTCTNMHTVRNIAFGIRCNTVIYVYPHNNHPTKWEQVCLSSIIVWIVLCSHLSLNHMRIELKAHNKSDVYELCWPAVSVPTREFVIARNDVRFVQLSCGRSRFGTVVAMTSPTPPSSQIARENTIVLAPRYSVFRKPP